MLKRSLENKLHPVLALDINLIQPSLIQKGDHLWVLRPGCVVLPYDQYEGISFIGRHFLDKESKTNAMASAVSKRFIQPILYMVVENTKGEFLSYARNGTETDLHTKHSVGFGGHIDLLDFHSLPLQGDGYYPTFGKVIEHSAKRELKEELNLEIDGQISLTTCFYDTGDEVGQRHLALVASIILTEEQEAQLKPSDEIKNMKWRTREELRDCNLEAWSKIALTNV